MTEETSKTPNFILGVGAQKAGTTWLFQYLNGHPDCAMGPVKEMGFFADSRIAVHNAINDGRANKHMLRAAKIFSRKGKLNAAATERLVGLLDAITARVQPDRYVEFYRRIVDANPHTKLIGDITPEYSGLHPDDVVGMKEFLDEMGYPVKVVFLMRDPVTRSFSAARMKDRVVSARNGNKKPNHSGDGFVSFATSKPCIARTRYEKSIPALERAFGADQIFYGIHEDFFNAAEVKRLCDFLEIPFIEPSLDVRVNAGKEEKSYSEAQAAEVRDFYAETYAFCRDRFGAERIDKLWTA